MIMRMAAAVTLAIGILAMYVIKFSPINWFGALSQLRGMDVLLPILILVWIGSSLLVKLLAIAGRSDMRIPSFALVCFVLFNVLAWVFGQNSTGPSNWTVEEILLFLLWYTSWPLFDLLALVAPIFQEQSERLAKRRGELGAVG